MHVNHDVHIGIHREHVAVTFALTAGIGRPLIHGAVKAGDDGLDLRVVGPGVGRVDGGHLGLPRYAHIGLKCIRSGQGASLFQHAKRLGEIAFDLRHEGSEISALDLRGRHGSSLQLMVGYT